MSRACATSARIASVRSPGRMPGPVDRPGTAKGASARGARDGAVVPMTEPQRVAIITGADRGIGAGLAAGFRGAGYAVVATSRSIAASEDSDVLTVEGDITQADTARRVVQQTLGRFGRIDSLVNNAGIYIEKPFTAYTLDDYAAITGVNLTGFFNITQPVIGQMISQGGGHVVNISTSLVDHAHSERPSALASLTKGALAAVTRSLAIEHASR